MDARQRLREGDVLGAFEALKDEVRKAPRTATLRTFLFQMFCVFGEWDRALTQLGVVAELDPLALPMAETYRTLIRCEMVRSGVFSGARTATLFGHPLPWVPLLIEANRALNSGNYSAAAEMRDQVFEQADAVSGTLGDQPFDWIADADPRLGPVLEAIVDGTYYWIPFQHIGRIKIEQPVDLRDQVWLPVDFTWVNGGTSVGFIPTRYPGSATAADPLLAVSRRTEWVQHGPEEDGWALGLGQRMFATNEAEVAVMDVRDLVLGEGGVVTAAADSTPPAS